MCSMDGAVGFMSGAGASATWWKKKSLLTLSLAVVRVAQLVIMNAMAR